MQGVTEIGGQTLVSYSTLPKSKKGCLNTAETLLFQDGNTFCLY